MAITCYSGESRRRLAKSTWRFAPILTTPASPRNSARVKAARSGVIRPDRVYPDAGKRRVGAFVVFRSGVGKSAPPGSTCGADLRDHGGMQMVSTTAPAKLMLSPSPSIRKLQRLETSDRLSGTPHPYLGSAKAPHTGQHSTADYSAVTA